MSGKVALRVRPARRPQAPDARLCTPWFARIGDAVPDSAPALLTFDDTDFLERFFAGVTASPGGRTAGAFPLLLPLRDWAEPPRAMRDAVGVPRYATSVVRRAAAYAGGTAGEDGKAGEAVLLGEEQETGVGWLRKLYLPTHRHFHLVATELVCDRPDRPRVDPGRVVEAGAVVRRLVADAGAKPVWEDWVPAGEGKGFWARVADADMDTRPAGVSGPARPLDPKAPRPADDTAIRARLGLGPKDPLPELPVVRLAPLPPAQGVGHTAYFGYLPVLSADVELPPDTGTLAANTAALKAEVEANLQADVGARATQVRDRVRAAWDALLDALSDPGRTHGRWAERPSPASRAAARTALVAEFGANPDATLYPAADDGLLDDASATDRLITALREEATEISGSVLQVPRWGGAGSVVSRWHDSLTLVFWAKGRLSLAREEAWLRHLLHDALDAVLTAPWSASWGAGDTADRRAHELVAAVLLWVRNHRLQLYRAVRAVIEPLTGTGDGIDPEMRQVWDPHAVATRVPLVTVGSLAGELEGFLVADEERARMPRPWRPIVVTPAVAAHIAVHRAAYALEEALTEVTRLGAGGGVGFDTAVRARQATLRGKTGLGRALGIDLDGQPELGLLVLGALRFDVTWPGVQAAAVAHYTTPPTPDVVPVELEGRKAAVLPRFDPDHVYAVWVYARVRDGDPCVEDRIAWSPRTEPFQIADTMDVLGLKPAPMRLPDLAQLFRDLPRVPRAGARPFTAVVTPPDSGFSTGADPTESARSWGIAWICSIGIPVFTICAWIAFSIILSILLAIPGFAWMLLLKICIPVPVPRRS